MKGKIRTVDAIIASMMSSDGKSRIPKNSLGDLISAMNEVLAEGAHNELFERGTGYFSSNRRMRQKQKPSITVSREIKKSSFGMYQYKHGNVISVGANMDSAAPDIMKKYDVLADMYFRIVARTPYDEDYIYTKANPHANGKNYRTKAGPGNKRVIVPYTPYVREHKKDDIVVRDTWKLTIKNTDGSSVVFFPKNFKVSFENVTNKTAYMSISKTLREQNMGEDGPKDFSTANITNDNPYVDVLENGRYVQKDSTEMHEGEKRFHGVNGGYSVQAPRGMVGITMMEFQQAETIAASQNRQVDIKDIGFTMSLPINANDKLRQAMQNVTEFVNEKDILTALNKGLKQIPLRNQSVQKVRQYYQKLMTDEILREDEKDWQSLKEAIEKEEREILEEERAIEAMWQQEKEANDKARRDRRNELRRKRYAEKHPKSNNLVVTVATPKTQKSTVVVKAAASKKNINDYIKMSNTKPIYGEVKFKAEGELVTVHCKIDKGQIYLTYASSNNPKLSSGYKPAESFLKGMFGKLSDSRFNKIMESFTEREI